MCCVYCLFVWNYAGTGKGGTSIWGRKFEDEFSEHLKVSRSTTSQFNKVHSFLSFPPSRGSALSVIIFFSIFSTM